MCGMDSCVFGLLVNSSNKLMNEAPIKAGEPIKHESDLILECQTLEDRDGYLAVGLFIYGINEDGELNLALGGEKRVIGVQKINSWSCYATLLISDKAESGQVALFGANSFDGRYVKGHRIIFAFLSGSRFGEEFKKAIRCQDFVSCPLLAEIIKSDEHGFLEYIKKVSELTGGIGSLAPYIFHPNETVLAFMSLFGEERMSLFKACLTDKGNEDHYKCIAAYLRTDIQFARELFSDMRTWGKGIYTVFQGQRYPIMKELLRGLFGDDELDMLAAYIMNCDNMREEMLSMTKNDLTGLIRAQGPSTDAVEGLFQYILDESGFSDLREMIYNERYDFISKHFTYFSKSLKDEEKFYEHFSFYCNAFANNFEGYRNIKFTPRVSLISIHLLTQTDNEAPCNLLSFMKKLEPFQGEYDIVTKLIFDLLNNYESGMELLFYSNEFNKELLSKYEVSVKKFSGHFIQDHWSHQVFKIVFKYKRLKDFARRYITEYLQNSSPDVLFDFCTEGLQTRGRKDTDLLSNLAMVYLERCNFNFIDCIDERNRRGIKDLKKLDKRLEMANRTRTSEYQDKMKSHMQNIARMINEKKVISGCLDVLQTFNKLATNLKLPIITQEMAQNYDRIINVYKYFLALFKENNIILLSSDIKGKTVRELENQITMPMSILLNFETPDKASNLMELYTIIREIEKEITITFNANSKVIMINHTNSRSDFMENNACLSGVWIPKDELIPIGQSLNKIILSLLNLLNIKNDQEIIIDMSTATLEWLLKYDSLFYENFKKIEADISQITTILGFTMTLIGNDTFDSFEMKVLNSCSIDIIKAFQILKKYHQEFSNLICQNVKTLLRAFCTWCGTMARNKQEYSCLAKSVAGLIQYYSDNTKHLKTILMEMEKKNLNVNVTYTKEHYYITYVDNDIVYQYEDKDFDELYKHIQSSLIRDKQVNEDVICNLIRKFNALKEKIIENFQLGVPAVMKMVVDKEFKISFDFRELNEMFTIVSHNQEFWSEKLYKLKNKRDYEDARYLHLLPIPEEHLYRLMYDMIVSDTLSFNISNLLSSMNFDIDEFKRQLPESEIRDIIPEWRNNLKPEEQLNSEKEAVVDSYINCLNYIGKEFKAHCAISSQGGASSHNSLLYCCEPKQFAPLLLSSMEKLQYKLDYSNFLICNKRTTKRDIYRILDCSANYYDVDEANTKQCNLYNIFVFINPEQLSGDVFAEFVDKIVPLFDQQREKIIIIQQKGLKSCFNISKHIQDKHSINFDNTAIRNEFSADTMQSKLEIIKSKRVGVGKTTKINELAERANETLIKLSLDRKSHYMDAITHLQKLLKDTTGDNIALHITANLSFEKKLKLLPLLTVLCYLDNMCIDNQILDIKRLKHIYLECRENTYDLDEYLNLTKPPIECEFSWDGIDYDLADIKAFIENNKGMTQSATESEMFMDILMKISQKPKEQIIEQISSYRELHYYITMLSRTHEIVSNYSAIYEKNLLHFKESSEKMPNLLDLKIKEIDNVDDVIRQIHWECISTVLQSNKKISKMDEIAGRGKGEMLDTESDTIYPERKSILVISENGEMAYISPTDKSASISNTKIKDLYESDPNIYLNSREHSRSHKYLERSAKGLLSLCRIMKCVNDVFWGANEIDDGEGTSISSFTVEYYDTNQNYRMMKLKTSDESRVPKRYIFTSRTIYDMLLIYLRTLYGLPTVIMGEAGIGKTEKLSVLFKLLGLKFFRLPVHSGTLFSEIQDILGKVIEASRFEKCVLFIDEANTSKYISFFEMLAIDKDYDGLRDNNNVVIILACNPCRKKTKGEMEVYKDYENKKQDNKSLAYSVQPLPLSLQEIEIDFGDISMEDFYHYIVQCCNQIFMISEANSLYNFIVKTVYESFLFLKKKYINVSLRDLARLDDVVKAINQHKDIFKIKKDNMLALTLLIVSIKIMLADKCPPKLARNFFENLAAKLSEEESFKSILNSLSTGTKENPIYALYKKVRDDTLRDCKVLIGISLNNSLKDNLFSLIIAALTRIPLYIIGKPGTSKSVSLQILEMNSKAEKPLANIRDIMLISHQCSTNTTSNDLLECKAKADKFCYELDTATLVTDKDGSYYLPDHTTICLFEELGLAEQNGTKNPLKVLHHIMEEYKSEIFHDSNNNDAQDVFSRDGIRYRKVIRNDKDVTLFVQPVIVCISNSILDVSKMSRGIVLIKADLELNDLKTTANDMIQSYKDETHIDIKIGEKLIDRICEACYTVITEQKEHSMDIEIYGSRNFYSLISDIIKCNERDLSSCVNKSFGFFPVRGGQDNEIFEPHKVFREKGLDIASPYEIDQRDFITQNLSNTDGRHIMVITDSFAETLNLIEHIESEQERIRGERYSIVKFIHEDSPNFVDETLKKIIEIMTPEYENEHGIQIIFMMNCSTVYPALYGIFNKSYTVRNGVSFAKIAFGSIYNEYRISPNCRFIVNMFLDDIPCQDNAFVSRFEIRVFTHHYYMKRLEKDKLQYINSIMKPIAEELEKINMPAVLKHDLSTKYLFSVVQKMASHANNINMNRVRMRLCELVPYQFKEKVLRIMENYRYIANEICYTLRQALDELASYHDDYTLKRITFVLIDKTKSRDDIQYLYITEDWAIVDTIDESVGRIESDVVVYVPKENDGAPISLLRESLNFYFNYPNKKLIVITNSDENLIHELQISYTNIVGYYNVTSGEEDNAIKYELNKYDEIGRMSIMETIISCSSKWNRLCVMERDLFKKNFWKALNHKDEPFFEEKIKELVMHGITDPRSDEAYGICRKRLTCVLEKFLEDLYNCGIMLWNDNSIELKIIDEIIFDDDMVKKIRNTRKTSKGFEPILLYGMYKNYKKNRIGNDICELEKYFTKKPYAPYLPNRLQVYFFIRRFTTKDFSLNNYITKRDSDDVKPLVYKNIIYILDNCTNRDAKDFNESADCISAAIALNILYLTGELKKEKMTFIDANFFGGNKKLNLIKLIKNVLLVEHGSDEIKTSKLQLAKRRYWGIETFIQPLIDILAVNNGELKANLYKKARQNKLTLVKMWKLVQDAQVQLGPVNDNYFERVIKFSNNCLSIIKITSDLSNKEKEDIIKTYGMITKYIINDYVNVAKSLQQHFTVLKSIFSLMINKVLRPLMSTESAYVEIMTQILDEIEIKTEDGDLKFTILRQLYAILFDLHDVIVVNDVYSIIDECSVLEIQPLNTSKFGLMLLQFARLSHKILSDMSLIDNPDPNICHILNLFSNYNFLNSKMASFGALATYLRFAYFSLNSNFEYLQEFKQRNCPQITKLTIVAHDETLFEGIKHNPFNTMKITSFTNNSKLITFEDIENITEEQNRQLASYFLLNHLKHPEYPNRNDFLDKLRGSNCPFLHILNYIQSIDPSVKDKKLELYKHIFVIVTNCVSVLKTRKASTSFLDLMTNNHVKSVLSRDGITFTITKENTEKRIIAQMILHSLMIFTQSYSLNGEYSGVSTECLSANLSTYFKLLKEKKGMKLSKILTLCLPCVHDAVELMSEIEYPGEGIEHILQTLEDDVDASLKKKSAEYIYDKPTQLLIDTMLCKDRTINLSVNQFIRPINKNTIFDDDGIVSRQVRSWGDNNLSLVKKYYEIRRRNPAISKVLCYLDTVKTLVKYFSEMPNKYKLFDNNLKDFIDGLDGSDYVLKKRLEASLDDIVIFFHYLGTVKEITSGKEKYALPQVLTARDIKLAYFYPVKVSKNEPKPQELQLAYEIVKFCMDSYNSLVMANGKQMITRKLRLDEINAVLMEDIPFEDIFYGCLFRFYNFNNEDLVALDGNMCEAIISTQLEKNDFYFDIQSIDDITHEKTLLFYTHYREIKSRMKNIDKSDDDPLAEIRPAYETLDSNERFSLLDMLIDYINEIRIPKIIPRYGAICLNVITPNTLVIQSSYPKTVCDLMAGVMLKHVVPLLKELTAGELFGQYLADKCQHSDKEISWENILVDFPDAEKEKPIVLRLLRNALLFDIIPMRRRIDRSEAYPSFLNRYIDRYTRNGKLVCNKYDKEVAAHGIPKLCEYLEDQRFAVKDVWSIYHCLSR